MNYLHRNHFTICRIASSNMIKRILHSSWTYKTEEELKSRSHWGQLTTYKGGGFTQLLSTTKNKSQETIDELKVRKFWKRYQ